MPEPSFITPFVQSPPQLGNQFEEDRVLGSWMRRTFPATMTAEIEPHLSEMGELAGGELYRLQLEDRLHEPRLERWDPWGERVDRVRVSALWERAEQLAAEHGLVASAYERRFGALSRLYQFALVYLFHPSSDVYTCPLAMTDGAARTLLESGNRALIERAVPRLTSRDPEQFWTSGQWMTESTGGSDVGLSETGAVQDERGGWSLHGRKWFTSAAASDIALTLARPQGNPAGGRGLALFYLEPRDANGRLRNIRIHRLKDKLGTRKVPTAELTLDGAPAELVAGTEDGVRNIVPMLAVTRTWNSVSAVSFMRRGLALARDFARRRIAFGRPLARQPLHLDTLATLQSEMEGAFHLVFYLVALVGREEAGELGDAERALLRVLTSITKLTTGRQAVAVASEVLEAFGGAGYVEDTGLPVLLRDSQVLPIWEGTTNVLSLDTLRALEQEGGLAHLRERVQESRSLISDPELAEAAARAEAAVEHAQSWLQAARRAGPDRMEAGARRLALTLGRALQVALTAEHAQWSVAEEGDARSRMAACRLSRSAIDLILEDDATDLAALGNDEPAAADAPGD